MSKCFMKNYETVSNCSCLLLSWFPFDNFFNSVTFEIFDRIIFRIFDLFLFLADCCFPLLLKYISLYKFSKIFFIGYPSLTFVNFASFTSYEFSFTSYELFVFCRQASKVSNCHVDCSFFSLSSCWCWCC